MTVVSHDPPNPEIVIDPSVPPDGGSPITPPIDPPVVPVTDDRDRYLSLMENTIKEQNRQLQDLHTRIASAPAAPVVPAKTPEELRAEYYSNPHEMTRNIVREEMQATVKPLMDFVSGMKQTTQVDNLVTQFKNDARFAGQWDAQVEAAVRENCSTIPPAQLTDQVFGMMVLSAIGMKHAGMLRPAAGAPPAAPVTPPVTPAPVRTDPPHMRPSAPRGPNGDAPRAPRRPLSEEEKRIARENHMTDEQYLDFQELPSASVVSSKIGVPVPPVRV